MEKREEDRIFEGFYVFIEMCKMNGALLRHMDLHFDQEIERLENELCDYVLEEDNTPILSYTSGCYVNNVNDNPLYNPLYNPLNNPLYNPLYKEELKRKLEMLYLYRRHVCYILSTGEHALTRKITETEKNEKILSSESSGVLC